MKLSNNQKKRQASRPEEKTIFLMKRLLTVANANKILTLSKKEFVQIANNATSRCVDHAIKRGGILSNNNVRIRIAKEEECIFKRRILILFNVSAAMSNHLIKKRISARMKNAIGTKLVFKAKNRSVRNNNQKPISIVKS